MNFPTTYMIVYHTGTLESESEDTAPREGDWCFARGPFVSVEEAEEYRTELGITWPAGKIMPLSMQPTARQSAEGVLDELDGAEQCAEDEDEYAIVHNLRADVAEHFGIEVPA